MQFKEDPRNLIVPLELTKIIYSDWDAEQAILDRPDQVYGKALHGTGRVKFKNGNSYEGDFYNGMLHGIAYYRYQNLIQGKGKFTWTTGVVYEGEFTYNKISGIGTYLWSDGSIYKGSVVNGLRHGEGRFVANGESAIYEGQWQEGLRHGVGNVLFKSGAIFNGEFVAGNKQGQGKMIYPTQNFYEGAFNQDKKSGFGTMNWLTSNEKYYGEWQDNMQNGWGTHIWIEAKGEGSKYLRNRYEGEFENGERNGVGVFYYANGAKYIGSWQNNLKNGHAIFITDSGGIILGVFKADRLSQVFSTTENEQRTGILPREIAPKTKEEQDQLHDQINKANPVHIPPKKNEKDQPSQHQQPAVKEKVDPKATKKEGKDLKDGKDVKQTQPANEKLIGLNSPNNIQGSEGAAAINQKQIELNPYSYMIDISDLFRGQTVDILQIETNVQTMLLRHNSILRQWYKFFASKFEVMLNENTFSLNLEGFWKILRDAKLLNPNFTLSSLNRLFFAGIKNEYPLNYEHKQLKNQVDFIKQYGQKMNLNEIDDIFYLDYSLQSLQLLNNGKLEYDNVNQTHEPIKFEKTPVNIHEPTTVILFRHFIELLVRISYLKYQSLTELHRAIERVILNKLTPLYERKKGKGLNQSEDESKSIQSRLKINFEDYLNEFKPLFEQLAKERVRSQYGYIDKTVTLEDVFYILEKTGQLTETDKLFIVAHIEKYFDTEEGSLNQQSSVDQSSMQQQISKDERPKKRTKNNDASHMGAVDVREKEGLGKNLNKVEKCISYQSNELILYEFTDVILTFLVKKHKDLIHPKEDEQRNRILAMVNKLKLVRPKTKQTIVQPRLWPMSTKDKQQYKILYQIKRKEELKSLRITQESKAKQKKLNEEEKKREERERNMMGLEDQDVKSDNEEDEGSQESDY